MKKAKKIKVLVSPGWGAGWSTWAGSKKKAIAEYKPIVKFIENHKGKRGVAFDKKLETLVEQMKIDLGLDHFYEGGSRQLIVEEVEGPYWIHEYDGYEDIRTESPFWTDEEDEDENNV